jgi:hypothetical protein
MWGDQSSDELLLLLPCRVMPSDESDNAEPPCCSASPKAVTLSPISQGMEY